MDTRKQRPRCLVWVSSIILLPKSDILERSVFDLECHKEIHLHQSRSVAHNRQYSIFIRIGDQEGAISDPDMAKPKCVLAKTKPPPTDTCLCEPPSKIELFSIILLQKDKEICFSGSISEENKGQRWRIEEINDERRDYLWGCL